MRSDVIIHRRHNQQLKLPWWKSAYIIRRCLFILVIVFCIYMMSTDDFLPKRYVLDSSPNSALNSTTSSLNNNSNTSTLNNNNNTESTSNNTRKLNNTKETYPFITSFRVKSTWPVDKLKLGKELAAAFNLVTPSLNFTDVAVDIVNVTCLANCPRKKRSVDPTVLSPNSSNNNNSTSSNLPTSSIFVPVKNGIVFNATFSFNSTNNDIGRKDPVVVYNSFNYAQDTITEASTARVDFAVFSGPKGLGYLLEAFTVEAVYRLYTSTSTFKEQLESLEEVIDYPIPLSRLEAATTAPPTSPLSTTLLIPPWAIFLTVFISIIVVLFIAWLIYSWHTGTLKEGGTAFLIDSKEKKEDLTDRGPASHPYNINVNRPQNRSTPPPLVSGSTRAIRFDRSTSYDVGLVASTDVDKPLVSKENPLYSSLYKRRESRVQEPPIRKKMSQRKNLNQESNISTSYKPKFTRLTSNEKLSPFSPSEPPPYSILGSATDVDIKVEPSQSLKRLEGGAKKNSQITGNDLNTRNNFDINSSGAFQQPQNQPYYSPYPIFYPLQSVPNLYSLPPSPFYSTPSFHTPPAQSFFQESFSINSSPKLQTKNDDLTSTIEKRKKLAHHLVEDAFDDSGFSTDNVTNSNTRPRQPTDSIDKPPDLEEFKRILDEAFAFAKSKPAIMS